MLIQNDFVCTKLAEFQKRMTQVKEINGEDVRCIVGA